MPSIIGFQTASITAKLTADKSNAPVHGAFDFLLQDVMAAPDNKSTVLLDEKKLTDSPLTTTPADASAPALVNQDLLALLKNLGAYQPALSTKEAASTLPAGELLSKTPKLLTGIVMLTKEKLTTEPLSNQQAEKNTVFFPLEVNKPALIREGSVNSITETPDKPIRTVFGKPGWNQELSQNVVWMVREKQQTVSLTLNPPNLGPVQILVKLDNQQASVQFFAAAPEVQRAIQEGLPVLQELLGQAGIELGQADIGSRQQGKGNKNLPLLKQDARSDKEDDSVNYSSSPSITATKRGLVNLFA